MKKTERERERDDTEEKGETARWRGKSPTRRTCRPAWYFTVADLRGPTGAPRRFYNAASYITTLKPLTKDSWWDGSLQDRIIWVVICRRRCWFFGRVCCRVRVRPPAATDPPGLSWGPSGSSLFLPFSPPSRSPATMRRMVFFILSCFVVARQSCFLWPLYPDASRHFPYSISSRRIPRPRPHDGKRGRMTRWHMWEFYEHRYRE